MSRRQQKELQRLERALMETELEEKDWEQTYSQDYDIYNSDDPDVDLEDYSDEVYEAPSRKGLSAFLIMIFMIILSLSLLILLKLLGVL